VRSGRRVMLAALASPLLLLLGPVTFAQRIESDSWTESANGGFAGLIGGIWRALTVRPDLPEEAWSAASQVNGERILPVPLLDVFSGNLTPLLQTMPVVLAMVAMVTGYAGVVGHPKPAAGRAVFDSLGGWRPAVPFAILSGLIVGFLLGADWLTAIPVLALVGGITFLASGARTGWVISWAMLRDVALLVVAIVATGALAMLPFFTHYGALPRRRVPVEQMLDVPEYLWHFGVFLAIIGGYLLIQFWTIARELKTQGRLPLAAASVAAILLAACLLLAARLDLLPLFLLVPIGIAGIIIWFHQHSINHLIVLGTVTLALALSIVGERFRLERVVGDQDIGPRFLAITWMLLALASVPALLLLLEAGSARWPDSRQRAGRAIAWGSLALAAVLVLAAATLPALAFPEPTSAEGSGTAVLHRYDALQGDAAAIDWMRENIHGLPIILEGTTTGGPPGGRISATTGFPTVIGWTSTERQQRPGMDRLVESRLVGVNQIYQRAADFSRIKPLLQKYGVEFIYVGPYERALYNETGLAKFDRAVADGELTVAYEDDDVTIYRYPQPDGDA